MPIYLDNAATSYPKPEQVYRAVDHAMRIIGVAPGRGGYKQSLDAARLVMETRESISRLFAIKDSSRVAFTHSATESLNIAVQGLLKAGDHVVSTTMEHNSLARPLYMLANQGVDVTWVCADSDGYVTAAAIDAAIRPSTRLVALSHCSNVTGAVQPIHEIGAVTHSRGALLLVDAAQSAGSIPIDVSAMNIDLLAAPGHKGLLGPQGTGFLYCSEGVELKPLVVGGTGVLSSDLEQPEDMPERFESGTMNTSGIAGLKAGVDYILEVGIEAISVKERNLTMLLLEELSSIVGITVYNELSKKPRGSVVSFKITGQDPSFTGFRLGNDFDISVRVGLHCAPMAHRTIGTYPEGTIRVSPGYFNSESDIALFKDALLSITSG